MVSCCPHSRPFARQDAFLSCKSAQMEKTCFNRHHLRRGKSKPDCWLVGSVTIVITYWPQGVASLPHKCQPPLPSDRQHPSYGDCLEVKGKYCQSCSVLGCVHNVHSQLHTYMGNSYRSSSFGLSHWDPYAVRRGGCLELYYCNTVEWCWWDWSLICKTNWFLPRCMKCRRGLAMRILSVCQSVRTSVCLSHPWIVTKWKRDRSRFLYHKKEQLS